SKRYWSSDVCSSDLKIKIPSKSKVFLIFWVLIVLEVIFSGVFSPLLSGKSFNFPTEVANYVARFLIFTTFIVWFYSYKINLRKFMNTFILVLSLGMVVGVLQFLNWSGSGFFRTAYTSSEHHLNQMNFLNPSSRRITGMANFATATGGIAAFASVLIISMHLFYKKS